LTSKYNRRGVGVLWLAVSPMLCFFFSPFVVAQQTGPVTDMGFSAWDAVDDGDCEDRITFLGAKKVLVESGAYAAIKSYKLERERRTDFYTLRFRTKSRNIQLNCSGNRGIVIGQEHGTYIKFNDTVDEMTFYSAPYNQSNFNLKFKKH
jgi:hypothetical protein